MKTYWPSASRSRSLSRTSASPLSGESMAGTRPATTTLTATPVVACLFGEA